MRTEQGFRGLFMVVHRGLPDGHDVDLARYLYERRSLREEQRRKRDSLFAITLLAHVLIIQPANL